MRVIDLLSVTKAISRIGSPQRGHRSGKVCILGAPSRPIPGPGFRKCGRATSPTNRLPASGISLLPLRRALGQAGSAPARIPPSGCRRGRSSPHAAGIGGQDPMIAVTV
jgi:hypothetical protein